MMHATFFSRRKCLRKLIALPVGCLAMQSNFKLSAQGVNMDDKVDGLCSIAFNVAKFAGWPKVPFKKLSTEKLQEKATRFAEALKPFKPDLITFAEAPDQAICEAFAKQLEMECCYFSSSSGYAGAGFSRLKMISNENIAQSYQEKRETEKLFTRHWGKMILEDANGKRSIVHSLHLYPNSASRRLQEIDALITHIKQDLAANQNVLVQGDFNFKPDSEEYQKLLKSGLIDTFAHWNKLQLEKETKQESKSEQGNTFPSVHPVQRIDYIWTSEPLSKKLSLSEPLSEVPFKIDVKGRQSALSDHLPMLAKFE